MSDNTRKGSGRCSLAAKKKRRANTEYLQQPNTKVHEEFRDSDCTSEGNYSNLKNIFKSDFFASAKAKKDKRETRRKDVSKRKVSPLKEMLIVCNIIFPKYFGGRISCIHCSWKVLHEKVQQKCWCMQTNTC